MYYKHRLSLQGTNHKIFIKCSNDGCVTLFVWTRKSRKKGKYINERE